MNRTHIFNSVKLLSTLLGLLCVFTFPSLTYAAETPAAPPAGVSLVEFDSNRDFSVQASNETKSAQTKGATFGISDFMRMNKGTDKDFEGKNMGYRFPMLEEKAFSVINTGEVSIIYIPESISQELNLDITDENTQQNFLAALIELDEVTANGGKTIKELSPSYLFTSDKEVELGDYTYRFGYEVEEGYIYSGVFTNNEELKSTDGAIYASSGTLAMTSDVPVAETPTIIQNLSSFFDRLDWSPLWVSLKTTVVATFVIFFLGLLAAWLTINVDDRLKGVLDTFFTIPMVLPPTVCGFILLYMFGNASSLGRWFITHGVDIVFTWPAAVIACIVVGFPLMYRTTRGSFENLDASMLDAARTLGWSEPKIFAKLMLPLAWPTIASGTVLAFARAMGEFGATLFFAGNFAGETQTIPIAIYFEWMAGKTDVATFWAIVVIIVSFLVILIINVYSSRVQKYRDPNTNRDNGVDKEALELE